MEEEQLLYFWFAWMLIIIVTFFIESSKKRNLLLLWIFSILMMTNVFIYVDTIVISLAFFLTFFGAILFYVHLYFSLYRFLVTFCIITCYVSLLVWEIITPVWFFIPSVLLIPIIITCVTSFLIDPLPEQVATILLGLTVGHIVFEVILFTYHLHEGLGGYEFFVHLTLTVVLTLTFKIIFYVARQSVVLLKRYIV